LLSKIKKSQDKVEAIQKGMKKDGNLNENYGTNMLERGGKSHPVSVHNNHIHGSTKKRKES
jgi:hypothetical protein